MKLIKKYLNFFLFFTSLIFSFIFVELIVQFYLDPLSGTKQELDRIYKNSLQENLPISKYTRKKGFASIFGAENASIKIFNPKSPKKSLILGDSVTGGHGLNNKNYSYGEILAKKNLSKNFHIWHVNGGGIDQLFIKVLSEAQFLGYDNLTIAFIAHDVLRASTRFIYSSTKIKFEFNNYDGVKIILAEDLGDFYNKYLKAKRYYYLSFWYLKKYYQSKEHFFANYFPRYYKNLFNHIATELNYLSEKNNIEINLVMLPNSYKFKGIEAINNSFKNIMNSKYSRLKVYDLNECAKKKSLVYSVNFYEDFNFHPGPIGHQIIADCFVELIPNY